jgi:MFS family permease
MTPTVLALGLSQTLAWGSTYYLPAVLAGDMARDTGVSSATVFAVFSLALLVSGPLGPWAGRHIDRLGGRALLMGTNVVFALGLVLLTQAQGLWGLLLAWAVLGLAMGCGLYDAAFATLVRLHGERARNGITGITLMAGLASTNASFSSTRNPAGSRSKLTVRAPMVASFKISMAGGLFSAAWSGSAASRRAVRSGRFGSSMENTELMARRQRRDNRNCLGRRGLEKRLAANGFGWCFW